MVNFTLRQSGSKCELWANGSVAQQQELLKMAKETLESYCESFDMWLYPFGDDSVEYCTFTLDAKHLSIDVLEVLNGTTQ